MNIFRKWRSSPAIALTALVGVTAIWGSTFIVVQNAVYKMPVMDFLAVRFTAAALIMFILRPTCLRRMTRRGLWHGIVMGIALGAAYITQTYGLLSASATVSGFITGMFVVLTPVLSVILLRRKTNRFTWFAVMLATIGLAQLSLYGWAIGKGEFLTLICALFFAIHIVGLGEWSSQHDIYGFTLIQITTVAVISLAVCLPGGIVIPPDTEVWIAVGVTAVLATTLAFLIQTWAQSLVPPARAAVVMTMEPVFAGLFAVLIGGENLTLRILSGAACILAAMYIVQFKSIRNADQQRI